jgi:hypothetical protein
MAATTARRVFISYIRLTIFNHAGVCQEWLTKYCIDTTGLDNENVSSQPWLLLMTARPEQPSNAEAGTARRSSSSCTAREQSISNWSSKVFVRPILLRKRDCAMERVGSMDSANDSDALLRAPD